MSIENGGVGKISDILDFHSCAQFAAWDRRIVLCFVDSMWVGGGVAIAGLWVSVLYTYKLLSTSDQSRQGKHEV